MAEEAKEEESVVVEDDRDALPLAPVELLEVKHSDTEIGDGEEFGDLNSEAEAHSGNKKLAIQRFHWNIFSCFSTDQQRGMSNLKSVFFHS